MLRDGSPRLADERGEPAERDPIPRRESESGQLEPLRWLKFSLPSEPGVKCLLVEEELAAAAPVPATGWQLADRRREPRALPPVAHVIVGPPVPCSPPPQRGGASWQFGVRGCGRHTHMIGHCGMRR